MNKGYGNDAWLFNTNNGLKGTGDQFNNRDFAVAVRSIAEFNISPVPEPTTFFLFGAGLGGLALIGRKAQK